jgi:hypothetical protein
VEVLSVTSLSTTRAPLSLSCRLLPLFILDDFPLAAANKATMPQRNSKKSSVSITSHPTGAMQIPFRVDGTRHSLVIPNYIQRTHVDL